ncbi:MAG: hypothetical protein GY853_15380 [PVC group bacterium]|nr:hypothetical protein [PVC group bacterium]
MKIFIISTVRNAKDDYITKLENYVQKLELMGNEVHLPHRDTNQNNNGYAICQFNKNAIYDSDEVHIFYNSNSQGTHFDMGVAFAFGKKIKIIDNEKFGVGKSFPRMLTEWQKK